MGLFGGISHAFKKVGKAVKKASGQYLKVAGPGGSLTSTEALRKKAYQKALGQKTAGYVEAAGNVGAQVLVPGAKTAGNIAQSKHANKLKAIGHMGLLDDIGGAVDQGIDIYNKVKDAKGRKKAKADNAGAGPIVPGGPIDAGGSGGWGKIAVPVAAAVVIVGGIVYIARKK